MEKLLSDIKAAVENSKDKDKLIFDLREYLFNLSDYSHMPVDNVKWVDVNDVEANTYNPNAVARTELKLLQLSILSDGYTQPVVTYFDSEKGKYVIVDGFHRYYCCRNNEDIKNSTKGRVPIVVIDHDINHRMASTVRHNRARGKHSVQGMSDLVFKMLDGGMADEDICNELGMEAEELIKLKHITGFSKLFENVDYRKAWETTGQVKLRKKHEGEQNAQSE